MPDQNSNRRRFSRVLINLEADLSDGRLSVMACKTRDLSLQGVFVITDVLFGLGAPCELLMILRGMMEPLEMRMKARVVRREEDGVALIFEGLEGLDCWRHLSNLVRHNASELDDVARQEDELLRL